MPPQARQAHRIRNACREFTRATGIVLNFEKTDQTASKSQAPSSRIWQSSVNLSGEKGILHIVHPPHMPIDRRVHDACQLADVIAKLLDTDDETTTASSLPPSEINREELDRVQQIRSELKLISNSCVTNQTNFQADDQSVSAFGRSFSKGEVGGDLCEVVRLSGRQTLFAIGDATGNGLPAAMILSFVRGALFSQIQSPAQEIHLDAVMEAINRAFFQLSRSYHYMSLFLGIIDTFNSTVRYVNAGHPAVLLRRREKTHYLNADVPLLGVLDNLGCIEQQLSISQNDLFVSLTDGLTEALNPDGQILGLDAISKAIQPLSEAPLESIAKSLMAIYQKHTCVADFNDDLSFLLVRIHQLRQRGFGEYE